MYNLASYRSVVPTVEQRFPKPMVGGSNPSTPATKIPATRISKVIFYYHAKHSKKSYCRHPYF